MRVLVVEDEPRLAANIARAMREGAGYAVDLASEGRDGLMLAQSGSYDLVLLDLMVPGLRGDEILRQLRMKDNATPVLVLTAVSETQRKIDLLDLGADDYMTKPFDLGELIARTRALIRRGKGVRQTVLRFGVLELNTAEQSVANAGTVVELSGSEYRILEYLMHRPRAVVSKRELLEHLYDFTWEHHSNVIEAHVSNLRKKLRATTSETVLETLRGRGYRLVDSPESIG